MQELLDRIPDEEIAARWRDLPARARKLAEKWDGLARHLIADSRSGLVGPSEEELTVYFAPHLRMAWGLVPLAEALAESAAPFVRRSLVPFLVHWCVSIETPNFKKRALIFSAGDGRYEASLCGDAWETVRKLGTDYDAAGAVRAVLDALPTDAA